MEAVGVYLRTLREAHQLSRAAVAAQIGTHESQLVRIESGDQDSRGSLLMAFIAAVRGKAEDVQRLILDESATAEHGRQLAAEVLTQEDREKIKQLAASIPDEQLAEVLVRIEQLRSDPVALGRLNSRIAALVEEQFERDYREAKAPLDQQQKPWLPRRKRRKSIP